jgi:hypothetical protein
MAAFKESLSEFTDAAFGFIRATKESYDAGTRFMKMRVWIVAILLVDLAVTVGFVFFIGGQPLNLSVWYQPGFPSNMLVVKNEGGRPLKDVTLILDNRYSAVVDKIDRGPNGFELNHVFRDKDDFAPPDSYKPAQVEIRVDRDVVRVPIGTQGPQDG